jgi:hypothetical protein
LLLWRVFPIEALDEQRRLLLVQADQAVAAYTKSSRRG